MEQQTQKPAVPDSYQWGCAGVVFLILMALMFFFGLFDQNEKSDSGSVMNAKAEYSGTQFLITNLGPWPWDEVRIRINEKFDYHFSRIETNETLTVGVLQFADDEGLRLDPFRYKPQTISIRAVIGEDLEFWSGTFN